MMIAGASESGFLFPLLFLNQRITFQFYLQISDFQFLTGKTEFNRTMMSKVKTVGIPMLPTIVPQVAGAPIASMRKRISMSS